MSVMNKLMNTKLNKKGFTLAELLIVVAIIAVLVAISIPIFASQLEKSRDSVDEANIRAAYAELSAALISDDGTSTTPAALGLGSGWSGSLTDGSGTITFAFSGKGLETGWNGGTSVTSTDIGGLSVTNVAKAVKINFTVTTGAITAIGLSAS